MGNRSRAARAVAAVQGATASIVAPLKAAREPLLARLLVAQRQADRDRDGVTSTALNAVIVALSDAKHKAGEGLAAVNGEAAKLLTEVREL
jgi:hypothetical protein